MNEFLWVIIALPLAGAVFLHFLGRFLKEPLAGWLARNHGWLMRVTGALLIVAAFADPVRLRVFNIGMALLANLAAAWDEAAMDALLLLHAETMGHFRAIDDARMEATVYRGDHAWTVAGYLWSIYSHRGFHVGNMDIYLRAKGIKPPAYYPAIQR